MDREHAQKRISEHFKENGEGIIFCPYLICGGEKDPHVYFSKELWLEMCRQFIKKIEVEKRKIN